MKNNQTKLFFALGATLIMTTLAPLNAYANPRAIFARGECECNSDTEIVDADAKDALIAHKAVLASAGPGEGSEITAGVVTHVVGVRPAFFKGGGFQKLTVRADTMNSPVQDIFAVLHFSNGSRQVFQFNQFDGNPGSEAGWRTFTLSATSDNSNLILKRLVLVVHNVGAPEVRQVRFGKTTIYHFNQKPTKPQLLRLNPIEETCYETDQDS